MAHFDVNGIAILLAVVASMALGMAWYMGLAKPWMKAAGLTEDDVKDGGAEPFVWAAICQLIIGYFIAMLTPQFFDVVNAYNAVVVGVHMWVGFIITSMVLNHRYQMKSWSLTFIDGGYLLGVVIVQGIVIGLFG